MYENFTAQDSLRRGPLGTYGNYDDCFKKMLFSTLLKFNGNSIVTGIFYMEME